MKTHKLFKDEAALLLDENTFSFLSEQFLKFTKTEISGYGVVTVMDKFLHRLEYVVRTSSGHSVRVVMSTDDQNEGLKLLQEYRNTIQNQDVYWGMQWHTHPGMGTFWSTEDLRSQEEIIMDILDQVNTYGFLVFDKMEYLYRIFKWYPNGKDLREEYEKNKTIAGCFDIFYTDGCAKLNDTELLKRQPYTSYSKQITYKNYEPKQTQGKPPQTKKEVDWTKIYGEKQQDSFWNNVDMGYQKPKEFFVFSPKQDSALVIEYFDSNDIMSLSDLLLNLDKKELNILTSELNTLNRSDVAKFLQDLGKE